MDHTYTKKVFIVGLPFRLDQPNVRPINLIKSNIDITRKESYTPIFLVEMEGFKSSITYKEISITTKWGLFQECKTSLNLKNQCDSSQ